MRWLASHSPLPGFKLSLGITMSALSCFVIFPLVILVTRVSKLPLDRLWQAISSPRAVAAYVLSCQCALAGALIASLLGAWVAWVLERYEFPGRKLLDSLIDLPFALPTAVAGIALTALYGPSGWIGAPLESIGLRVAYTPIGITLAIVFIGLPFVVRSVQPVLQELEPEVEEAAQTLGASRWQTFWRIHVPTLAPSVGAGGSLALARGLGEYGSVVFIARNLPMRTEIAPLLIVLKLEEFDEGSAAAIALVMLGIAALLLALLHGLNRYLQRWREVS